MVPTPLLIPNFQSKFSDSKGTATTIVAKHVSLQKFLHEVVDAEVYIAFVEGLYTLLLHENKTMSMIQESPPC